MPTSDKIQPGLQCTLPVPGANTKNHKIVGGNIVDRGTYPWQVRLSLDGMYQCGGSIIHDNWILTAAHCCDQISNVDVFVGDWDQWSSGDQGEFSVASKKIIKHPQYPGRNGIANDVCLLKINSLAEEMSSTCDTGDGNKCYAAACLPAKDYEHGEACHVSGWGTTKEGGGGSVSRKLQEVGVNLFSHSYCNTYVNNDFKGATIDGLEICGGTYDKDGDGLTDSGKDSCQGDSGGPLTCVRDDQPVVAGVVSWGYGCANKGYPGVYANTYAYVDWIKTTTAAEGIPITGPAVVL